MRRWLTVVLAAALSLGLSGCTLARFWLSGCGGTDPDLVVVNNSAMAVGSITLDYGRQTETVCNADGHALLERGDSYGLELEEDTQKIAVLLSGLEGEELARCSVSFDGERLYLTLEADGSVTVSREEK